MTAPRTPLEVRIRYAQPDPGYPAGWIIEELLPAGDWFMLDGPLQRRSDVMKHPFAKFA